MPNFWKRFLKVCFVFNLFPYLLTVLLKKKKIDWNPLTFLKIKGKKLSTLYYAVQHLVNNQYLIEFFFNLLYSIHFSRSPVIGLLLNY